MLYEKLPVGLKFDRKTWHKTSKTNSGKKNLTCRLDVQIKLEYSYSNFFYAYFHVKLYHSLILQRCKFYMLDSINPQVSR